MAMGVNRSVLNILSRPSVVRIPATYTPRAPLSVFRLQPFSYSAIRRQHDNPPAESESSQAYTIRKVIDTKFINKNIDAKSENEVIDHKSKNRIIEYKPENKKRDETPAYELTFTCKPCKTRSGHRITKQAYHKGTVLITCPGCKVRHVMADHLKIFSDKSTTIEDIMRDRGELVKKGTLAENGDFELWDDGTTTPRESSGESSSQSLA